MPRKSEVFSSSGDSALAEPDPRHWSQAALRDGRLPGEGLLDFYLRKLGVPAINWLGRRHATLVAVALDLAASLTDQACNLRLINDGWAVEPEKIRHLGRSAISSRRSCGAFVLTTTS